jgi:hypothetical protein
MLSSPIKVLGKKKMSKGGKGMAMKKKERKEIKLALKTLSKVRRKYSHAPSIIVPREPIGKEV